LEFGVEEIKVSTIKLDDAALATETTLNAKDRALKALQAKPAYPDQLAEMTGLARGTVVNCLTQLKRTGKVNVTGNKDGRAEEVEVTPPPSVSIRSGDGGDRGGKGEAPTDAQIREVLTNPEYFQPQAKVFAEYRQDPTPVNLDRLTRSILFALKVDTEDCRRYRHLVAEAVAKEGE
jgi:hypothetical protein